MVQPTRPVLLPAITCENVDKTYDHFTSVLGFGGQGKMPGPDGSTMHAEVFFATRKGEARIMMGPRAMVEQDLETSGEFGRNLSRGPLGNGVSFYIEVPDVDKYFDFVAKKGADIVNKPTDQFWGMRDFTVRVPDGYFLNFATPIKGFKWSGDALASMHDTRKPAAPGATKGSATPGTRRKTGSKAKKKPTARGSSRTSKKGAARKKRR